MTLKPSLIKKPSSVKNPLLARASAKGFALQPRKPLRVRSLPHHLSNAEDASSLFEDSTTLFSKPPLSKVTRRGNELVFIPFVEDEAAAAEVPPPVSENETRTSTTTKCFEFVNKTQPPLHQLSMKAKSLNDSTAMSLGLTRIDEKPSSCVGGNNDDFFFLPLLPLDESTNSNIPPAGKECLTPKHQQQTAIISICTTPPRLVTRHDDGDNVMMSFSSRPSTNLLLPDDF